MDVCGIFDGNRVSWRIDSRIVASIYGKLNEIMKSHKKFMDYQQIVEMRRESYKNETNPKEN